VDSLGAGGILPATGRLRAELERGGEFREASTRVRRGLREKYRLDRSNVRESVLRLGEARARDLRRSAETAEENVARWRTQPISASLEVPDEASHARRLRNELRQLEHAIESFRRNRRGSADRILRLASSWELPGFRARAADLLARARRDGLRRPHELQPYPGKLRRGRPPLSEGHLRKVRAEAKRTVDQMVLWSLQRNENDVIERVAVEDLDDANHPWRRVTFDTLNLARSLRREYDRLHLHGRLDVTEALRSAFRFMFPELTEAALARARNWVTSARTSEDVRTMRALFVEQSVTRYLRDTGVPDSAAMVITPYILDELAGQTPVFDKRGRRTRWHLEVHPPVDPVPPPRPWVGSDS
jgi:hypothetical protein